MTQEVAQIYAPTPQARNIMKTINAPNPGNHGIHLDEGDIGFLSFLLFVSFCSPSGLFSSKMAAHMVVVTVFFS
jgi:hypothetical protein